MDEFTSGREPIQIIEIDQDFCDNVYGSAPCAAAVPTTGPDKCFNSRANCQDPTNYAASPLTLRFIKPIANAPKDGFYIPSLVSVSTSPTVINAGGGGRNTGALGARATLTATFTDHPYNDRLVDKYRAERSYIATDRSTFWAKWLKRNPYYQNRVIRVLDGYVGQSLSGMSSRTYLIDQITGPDSNGRVTIRAKDVLSLVDNRKAQAPALSEGELIEDEPLADTTLRITGALAAEYPAPGIVRIADELITYTGVSTISPAEINLTGCVRGTNGTTAEDQSLGDRVQWCLQYTTTNAVDVCNDLLTTYGNVNSAYIPITDWNAERDLWLTPFNVSAIISEPTGVNELLGELTEQCLFYIWWNERDQEIQLKAIRPATETPTPLSDNSNILQGSVAINEEPKERVSQIWIFWGQTDPTQSLTEDKNFAKVRIRADLDKESAIQYGEQVIKKIYSRWIVSDAQAINLGARLLARYRDNPQYMVLAVDAKDRALWTGDICNITHRNIVDEYGEELPTQFQIISAEESDSGHVVKYKLIRFEFTGNFSYWMAASAPLFTVATVEEKKKGCWWAGADGKMSDGSDGYTWQ